MRSSRGQTCSDPDSNSASPHTACVITSAVPVLRGPVHHISHALSNCPPSCPSFPRSCFQCGLVNINRACCFPNLPGLICAAEVSDPSLLHCSRENHTLASRFLCFPHSWPHSCHRTALVLQRCVEMSMAAGTPCGGRLCTIMRFWNQQGMFCRTPADEYEPPMTLHPDADPMEVIAKSGRDYVPGSFYAESPEDEYDPILVCPHLRCLCPPLFICWLDTDVPRVACRPHPGRVSLEVGSLCVCMRVWSTAAAQLRWSLYWLAASHSSVTTGRSAAADAQLGMA